MSEDEIKNMVLDMFHKAVKQFIDEHNAERDNKAFHVSMMSYDCPRLLYYAYNDDNLQLPDWDAYHYNIWIGTKLHETPITPNHEIHFEYIYRGYKVSGTFDEAIDTPDGRYIIDKKFVAFVPQKQMQEHHRRQVQYYSILHELLGIGAIKGVILVYFDRTYKNGVEPITIYVENFENKEDAKKHMFELLDKAIDGIESNTPPERKMGWYCNYCKYADVCLKEVKK